MESYKLVNSREMQEKAFRLGYDLNKDFVDDPFIILYADGKALKFSDIIDYANCNVQEITQADFLALPEPLKVGDWVRVLVDDVPFFAQIEFLDDGEVKFYGIHYSYNIGILEISKLTPEQIKVLGLEGYNGREKRANKN